MKIYNNKKWKQINKNMNGLKDMEIYNNMEKTFFDTTQ